MHLAVETSNDVLRRNRCEPILWKLMALLTVHTIRMRQKVSQTCLTIILPHGVEQWNGMDGSGNAVPNSFAPWLVSLRVKIPRQSLHFPTV